jgi:hypothetical protein
MMLEKGKWKEGDKIYGLPKIKTVRIKIKKEKAEKATETAAGASAETTSAAPAGKETASAKGAPKAQEKK